MTEAKKLASRLLTMASVTQRKAELAMLKAQNPELCDAVVKLLQNAVATIPWPQKCIKSSAWNASQVQHGYNRADAQHVVDISQVLQLPRGLCESADLRRASQRPGGRITCNEFACYPVFELPDSGQDIATVYADYSPRLRDTLRTVHARGLPVAFTPDGKISNAMPAVTPKGDGQRSKDTTPPVGYRSARRIADTCMNAADRDLACHRFYQVCALEKLGQHMCPVFRIQTVCGKPIPFFSYSANLRHAIAEAQLQGYQYVMLVPANYAGHVVIQNQP